MLQDIIGQKGKKYNDFQGKRLGLVVNDANGEETLADVLTEPGVFGFNKVDLSKKPEDYQTEPGVNLGFQPVTKVTSKADLFKPREENKEYDDVIDNLKFLSSPDRPEKPERNDKLDKYVRLAQFANLIGQGVSHYTGGFVSPTDITEGYWDKIAQMDEGYARSLQDWNRQVFEADAYNSDLYNDAVLQQQDIDAANEADQIDFDRRKELKQMDIDARKGNLEKELNSKKAYNAIARTQNQEDYLKAILDQRDNLVDDLARLQSTDEFGRPNGYTDDRKAATILQDIERLDADYNSGREQLGGMLGFDVSQRRRVNPDRETNFRGQRRDGSGPRRGARQQGQFTQSELDQLTSDTLDSRGALDNIENQLQSGSLSPEDAIPRIAEILMKEKGMSREEALDVARQAVTN